jgi:hypothetical protein
VKKQPDIYLVDWVDSCGRDGWLHEDECKAEVSRCQTVGFLVEETKEAIALALNRTATEGHRPFGEIITIPKCAILKKVKK